MIKKISPAILLAFVLVSCAVSYTFNGASIDYNKTKSIHINDFMNQAPLVYPPLTQEFNERLKDVFDRNTKLVFTDTNPDLELEGEITRYDLTPLSVKENQDGPLASETRLTMTVRMRYRNNVEPEKDKEQSFTAYQDFPSDNMLSDVQDALIEELAKEIVDQIFNSTMSDW